jgi:hypothetical protein
MDEYIYIYNKSKENKMKINSHQPTATSPRSSTTPSPLPKVPQSEQTSTHPHQPREPRVLHLPCYQGSTQLLVRLSTIANEIISKRRKRVRKKRITHSSSMHPALALFLWHRHGIPPLRRRMVMLLVPFLLLPRPSLRIYPQSQSILRSTPPRPRLVMQRRRNTVVSRMAPRGRGEGRADGRG